MGQCKKYEGVTLSSKCKLKLILQCYEGQTVSGLTSEGDLPMPTVNETKGGTICWNLYKWPLLQNGPSYLYSTTRGRCQCFLLTRAAETLSKLAL